MDTTFVHVIVMSLMVFILCPIGYGLNLCKNEYYYKIIQSINITLFFLFCIHALFASDFSDGNSDHSVLSKFICLLIIIEIFLFLLKNRFYYHIEIFLVFILLPFQWLLGVYYIMTQINISENSKNFGGHTIIGGSFIFGGIYILWNHKQPNKIMKIEICGLCLVALIEFIAEAIVYKTFSSSKLTDLNHLIICSLFFCAGLCCFVYWQLNIPNRDM
eukprot:176949_1